MLDGSPGAAQLRGDGSSGVASVGPKRSIQVQSQSIGCAHFPEVGELMDVYLLEGTGCVFIS